MRCYCCNRALNDFESTRKDTHGNYLDICNKCFDGLDIPVIERDDLAENEQPEDEEDWDHLTELDYDGEEDGLQY